MDSFGLQYSVQGVNNLCIPLAVFNSLSFFKSPVVYGGLCLCQQISDSLYLSAMVDAGLQWSSLGLVVCEGFHQYPMVSVGLLWC